MAALKERLETLRHIAARKFARSEGYSKDDVDIHDWQENVYSIGGAEYLCLTDDEAEQYAYDYVEETAWEINPSFLVDYMPPGVDESIIEHLQEKCESANPAILRLCGGRVDEMIRNVIEADGRAHSLAGYDGCEHEIVVNGEYFYLYRIN